MNPLAELVLNFRLGLDVHGARAVVEDQDFVPQEEGARLLRAGEMRPTFSKSRSVEGLTPRMRAVSTTVSSPTREVRTRRDSRERRVVGTIGES